MKKYMFLIPIIIAPVMFGVAVYLLLHPDTYRDLSVISIPQELPVEGLKIPVFVTFTNISRNSLSPSLIFYNDHIQYKVFKTNTSTYENIEKVDILTKEKIKSTSLFSIFGKLGYFLHMYEFGDSNYTPSTIIFYFKDKSDVFHANLWKQENFIQALTYLKNKKVVLSQEAEIYITK